jgi:Tol biopolymer transport system component
MLTLETGDVTQVPAPEGIVLVFDWSADGRYLVFGVVTPETRADVMWLDLEGGNELLPVMRAEGFDWPGRLSPDGRFVTYFSGSADPEANVGQMFVTEFPGAGGTWQVSTEGTWIGELSVSAWSHDGQELYYVDRQSRLMAVDVDTRRGFRASPPRVLLSQPGGITFVDAHPDGRILVLVQAEDQVTPPISLIVDWPAELERRRQSRPPRP